MEIVVRLLGPDSPGGGGLGFDPWPDSYSALHTGGKAPRRPRFCASEPPFLAAINYDQIYNYNNRVCSAQRRRFPRVREAAPEVTSTHP